MKRYRPETLKPERDFRGQDTHFPFPLPLRHWSSCSCQHGRPKTAGRRAGQGGDGRRSF